MDGGIPVTIIGDVDGLEHPKSRLFENNQLRTTETERT